MSACFTSSYQSRCLNEWLFPDHRHFSVRVSAGLVLQHTWQEAGGFQQLQAAEAELFVSEVNSKQDVEKHHTPSGCSVCAASPVLTSMRSSNSECKNQKTEHSPTVQTSRTDNGKPWKGRNKQPSLGLPSVWFLLPARESCQISQTLTANEAVRTVTAVR